MTDKKPKKKNELMLEISPAIEGGVYSNLVNIIHSHSEFILDFAMVLPGKQAARVQSRVVISPKHAKQFLLALQDNIEKFEQVHGEIQVEPAPKMSGPNNSFH